MSGITGMFSAPHYGSGMADVAQMSMRPTFELQFSLLQDQVIKRLNTEIEQSNQSTKKVDAFLVLEKARLQRLTEGMDKFHVDAGRNHNTLADMNDLFTELQGHLTAMADDSADSSAFDAVLAKLNGAADYLINVDGTTTGIIFEDGTRGIRDNGALRFDNGDGSGRSHKATSFADFGTKAKASAAISEAVSRLYAAQIQTDLKIETIVGLDEKAGMQIAEVTLEIEAAKTAAQGEKAAAIAKLKDKYAQMLNAMSIAFEGSAAQSDYFAKHLLAQSEVQPGSVMNLFT